VEKPALLQRITFTSLHFLLSALQYQVAQLFSVAEASKENTGGGEGIEVLKNEPFTDFPLLGKSFTICN